MNEIFRFKAGKPKKDGAVMGKQGIVVFALVLTLSGCSSDAGDYELDPTKISAPSVPNNILSNIPAENRNHVAALAVTLDSSIAVTLTDAACAINVVAADGSTTDLPLTRPSNNDGATSLPFGDPIDTALGPLAAAQTQMGDATVTFYCGPRGAVVQINEGFFGIEDFSGNYLEVPTDDSNLTVVIASEVVRDKISSSLE